MIVCVPAIPRYLHCNTVPSIIQTDLDCFVCNVSSPNSYYDYFVSWWYRYPLGFTIVEHDVEILPPAVTETKTDILNEMLACDSPWCCSPYNDKRLLGCTKFVPHRLQIDFKMVREFSTSWENLDLSIYRSIRKFGEQVHKHRRGSMHHATRYSE